MGEVYQARDTRLDRTVAIKVLPEAIAGRADLRERFDREARAVSNLSHPHICALYDVGHQNGVNYLVMEYLEGETLAERLAKGPLPLNELLSTAVQISGALDVAHRQGFVHRDLKPGNIMLTRSGAKLLDFGLAKSALAEPSPSSHTAAPTATSPLTAEGTIVGTFQYMAPEQLEGGQADPRSDIFSFGAVLYEMATGRQAFEGKTQASLAASILKEEPRPLSALSPMTPPALERVVGICLAKDPDDRWQTTHDLALQLRWIAEAGSEAGIPAPVAARRRSRERIWMAVAGVMALAALALALGLLSGLGRSTAPAPEQVIATILPPPDATFAPTGGTAGPAVLSPDGRQVVFSAATPGVGQQLWVRSLQESASRPLPGTENGARPFWSPDGRFIGFFSGAKLRKVELVSGSSLTICDAPDGRGGSWNADGTIIFSPNFRGPVFRVDATGGQPEPVTVMDASMSEGTHRYPTFLPDGRHFIYLTRRTVAGTPEDTGIWLGSLDSKERKLLTRAESNGVYASGKILFARERTLLAQSFDLDTLELTGEPAVIAKDLLVDPVFSLGVFSASQTGVLLYQAGEYQDESRLVWLDREGNEQGVLEESGSFQSIGISPDDGRVALSINDPGPGRNIWIHDLSRGIRSRFSFASDAMDGLAQWSPDGREIVYTSTVDGSLQIFRKPTSGAGRAESLMKWEGDAWPTSWSPDGQRLLFTALTRADAEASSDIMLISLDEGQEIETFIGTEFAEDNAKFSPDGRWVAYTSNESGRGEVYVVPYPEPDGKWQVSSVGGGEPRWRGDGREITYIAPGNRVMAVEVDGSGSGMQVGREKELFTYDINTGNWASFDVTSDGQRFLVISSLEQSIIYPITLVLNWKAALEGE
jgi:Tol biopolymer transport system component